MTDHNDQHEPDTSRDGDEDAKIYELPVNPSSDDTGAQAPDAEHTSAAKGERGEHDELSVVDSELVEQVPVDPPQESTKSQNPLQRNGKRHPILPAWLKSRQEFHDTARWAVGYTAHVGAYHALRCPVYLARLIARAPQGTIRLVGGLIRWVTDAEGHPVRNAAARREDGAEYLKLARLRDGRVRGRSFLLATGGAAGVAAVLTGVELLPALAQWAAVTVAAAGMGWFGAPADKPVISRAVESTTVPKLTSNAVEDALAALGISQISQAMSKGGAGIGFPKPISRDGKGWRADVDLPRGVTPSDIMERRAKLASGLRRPLGCVWPEGDPSEHEGRLVLWVGDQDMRKAKQPAWALRKGTRVDVFQPQPFGTDQRGRWVNLTLMFIAVAIGAIPRMGKTFALRELLLIGALDPRVELHTYDLKGTGDLDPLEPVTHRHGVGDDEDQIEYAVTDLRGLRDELRRRAKLIRDLAKQGLCPENKVTPELADKKSLGLHPIVIGVDECQVWFEHPEYGEELEGICTDLVKRGPALGIILILATQRPDAKSLPTGISANVSTRFCLKVQGQTENDMVLGTSKYKQGVRATTFSWEDKGIGYLVGEGSDARIVRTVYLDGPAAEKIGAYARYLREQAGTLSGHAIGQTPDVEQSTQRDTLLEDVLAVVPETEPKVWSERVLDRLAELRPEVYGGWEADRLSAALKRHDVKANRQVWGTDADGEGRNRRGFHRADVAETVAERNRKRDAG